MSFHSGQRNFGLSKTNGPDPRGLQHPAHSLHALRNTQRNSYPLPAQSLRPDPLAAATRERAALSFVTVLLSLTFLAPLILAWAMIKFR